MELILLKLIAPNFVTWSNLISLGRQSAITAIVAMGMTFILVGGGIDLSLGAQVAVTGMTTAWFIVKLNIPLTPAIILCLIVGICLGFINGFICTKINIHPLIITMALSIVYRGIAKIVNNGMPLYNLPTKLMNFDRIYVLGIPIINYFLLLLILIGSYILNKTYLGKYIYAVGENEKTAELAGIDTVHTKWIIYSIAGLFSGIASILLLAKVGSAQPNAMANIELDVFAAAAIGGIGFTGGRGHLINIVLGVLVLEIIGNAFIILDVGEYYRSIFKGLVLLGALAMDGAIKNR